MAIPSISLVVAIRDAAQRLRAGAYYNWCHQGSCNCGHLVQSLTGLTKTEIHRLALERKGDWENHARDYCPDSGYAIDDIITLLLKSGLHLHDIRHLERLSDPTVLSQIPTAKRQTLSYKKREDVILYLDTWAQLLADQCIEEITLPHFPDREFVNQY